MNSLGYAFVNPLLGADDAWSAYFVELSATDDPAAPLADLCHSALLADFDQRHPWLIPAIAGFSAPPIADRAITVFSATSAVEDDALKSLESELRQASRKVALKALPDSKLPGAGSWDFLLLAASHARSLPPYTLLGIASRTTIVATDLHTHGDRDWALANACTLSTSEYLQTRPPIQGKADMTRLKLLKLLALIDGDAETGALDEIFREEPKLSYSLLRLVNSAALAPRSPITSYSQAINILGRRQLQRWLQLLVYADANSGQQPNPLLQKAAARGRLMELLASYVLPEPVGESATDTAFMIGTFSLLDVLLNMPIPEVLQHLPLSDLARDALSAREGVLGQLLSAIDLAEKRDIAGASTRLADLKVNGSAFTAAQLQALSWAAKIRGLG